MDHGSSAATSPEDLWRAAPLGKIPGLEQLRALALRDVWKEFCKGDVKWVFSIYLVSSDAHLRKHHPIQGHIRHTMLNVGLPSPAPATAGPNLIIFNII